MTAHTAHTAPSLTALAHEVRDLSDRLSFLPYACPYARLARKRLEAAWEVLCQGRASCARDLITDAALHMGYAKSAAHIRTLRSEATAEAARSYSA